MSYFRRTWNTGNLLALLGLVALLLTFVWPYVTARRVARVESWAENIAGALLTASAEADSLDLADAGSTDRLLNALGTSEGERLQPHSPDDPAAAAGAYFEGKHYAYAVLRLPLTREPGAASPIEVYAWPLSNLGPGRTAFFFSQDLPPAYTHNLHTRYNGWDRVPTPGSGRAYNVEDQGAGAYRAQDGERWIEIAR